MRLNHPVDTITLRLTEASSSEPTVMLDFQEGDRVGWSRIHPAQIQARGRERQYWLMGPALVCPK
jgi:hypothetical protein